MSGGRGGSLELGFEVGHVGVFEAVALGLEWVGDVRVKGGDCGVCSVVLLFTCFAIHACLIV